VVFSLTNSQKEGFFEEWNALIHNFVFSDNVTIKVNDDAGRYFQRRKGSSQGDPLSLMFI
jgi:hypothetical protein